MKLNENQLRVLKKVYKDGDTLANRQVVEKLEKKGLVRKFVGSYITTQKGNELLKSIYGSDF